LDISSHGVYFVLDDNPGLGTTLNPTIAIPADITGGPEVSIHFKGAVLRVDSCRDADRTKYGVAAAIESYEITRNILLGAR
jgi:hypothetical protein